MVSRYTCLVDARDIENIFPMSFGDKKGAELKSLLTLLKFLGVPENYYIPPHLLLSLHNDVCTDIEYDMLTILLFPRCGGCVPTDVNEPESQPSVAKTDRAERCRLVLQSLDYQRIFSVQERNAPLVC